MNYFYPRTRTVVQPGQANTWLQVSALLTATDANQPKDSAAQLFIRPVGGICYLWQKLPGKPAPGAVGGPATNDTTVAVDQINDSEFRFLTMEGSPSLDWWDLNSLYVLAASGVVIYIGAVGPYMTEDIK